MFKLFHVSDPYTKVIFELQECFDSLIYLGILNMLTNI